MKNTGVDESQVGIKTAWKNINFIYADVTTLMAEYEEELESLLKRWKSRVKKLT